MPALALGMSRVHDRLCADQRGVVVGHQVDREHIADRRLPHEALLSRDPHTGLRGRIEEPQPAVTTPAEIDFPWERVVVLIVGILAMAVAVMAADMLGYMPTPG